MSAVRSSSQIFESLVVLLSMAPTVGPVTRSSGSQSVAQDPEEIEWEKFIDHLCCLCDNDVAGKTVSSIAVQQAPQNAVFWLTSNNGPSPSSYKHLKWLMENLEGFTNNNVTERDLYKRLLARCVEFSHKRVQNYLKRLRSLAASHRTLKLADRMNILLVEYIDKLLACEDDHKKLCTLAFDFRGTPMSTYMKQQILMPKRSPTWGALRHYIGRLGIWPNAVSLLIAMAKSRPTIFKQVVVKRVDCRLNRREMLDGRPQFVKEKLTRMLDGGPQVVEEKLTQMLDGSQQVIEEILAQIFPAITPEDKQKSLATLQDPRDRSITEEFAERLARRQKKPCVHAELVMLEFFYRKNLPFLDGRRYIGCSKPICYCCELYTRLHPMSVTIRPSHGNIWNRWALPHQSLAKTGLSTTAGHELMEMMVTEMCGKLKETLISGIGLAGSRPESTTNMS